MAALNSRQEKEVVRLMAKEFLEHRLGIKATTKNIRRLAAHITQFEREVELKSVKNTNQKLLHLDKVQ